MSNLIKGSDYYWKISGSLSQYYRDQPSDQIVNFKSFKSKFEISENTPNIDNKKWRNSSTIKILKWFFVELLKCH